MKYRSFIKWQSAAQAHADRIEVVAGDNLWDDDDSYELVAAAKQAFLEGESPEDFVERMFAEDLASREHDAQMEAEAFEQEGGDYEGEWE